MATFNPPTRLEGPRRLRFDPDPVRRAFSRHLHPYPVGKNVKKVNGVFTIVGPLQSDEFTGVEGVDYFLGGHVYTVSGALADELEEDLGAGSVESNPYANGYGDPY